MDITKDKQHSLDTRWADHVAGSGKQYRRWSWAEKSGHTLTMDFADHVATSTTPLR